MTPEERHCHYVEDIQPRLGTLLSRVCDASGIEDQVLEESRFQDLLAFYEEQAEACLRDGRAEALQRKDFEYVQRADEISRKWSS